MKKTLFLLLGIALACSASAQKKQPNGIFFEISGNGLKQPSYILGSNHEVNGTFVHQIPQFNTIFDKVKQTCFETDLDDGTDSATAAAGDAVVSLQQQQQSDIAKHLLLPADSTYAALLGSEKAAEIDKIMSDLFPSYVPNMRPVYASSILRTVTQVHQMSLTGIGSPFVSIDYYVHEKSQQAGKTIHSLEPRSLQDSIIARMRAANASKSATLRDQMMSFYVLCKTAALRIDNSLRNRMLYSRGQGLQIVQNTVSNSDYLRNVTKTIMNGFSNDESVNLMAVKERNALWMKKIPTLMKAEPTLFVVGIAHLYPYRDSKGLLADLRKKGYKIRTTESDGMR